jgi:hypothetical protein
MLSPRVLLVLAVLGCGHHSTGSTGSPDGGGCDPADPGCTTGGGDVRKFSKSSLIIPMDLSYQSTGMFQAYGLV